MPTLVTAFSLALWFLTLRYSTPASSTLGNSRSWRTLVKTYAGNYQVMRPYVHKIFVGVVMGYSSFLSHSYK
ncbi:hypothetical protein GGS20DRAFT_526813 [Poronia punctata]|nr:hypothetical protein GGS20DRAFT_526813 [Poronia punctata]